jgi:manganese oxidase
MSPQHLPTRRLSHTLLWLILLLSGAAASAQAQTVTAEPTPMPAPAPAPTPNCERRITAKVVAFNQVLTFNRLGAVNPYGLMYALERDVEASDPAKGPIAAGNVKLRADKRPRPIVLRMNVGDCLIINFRNLITPGTAGGSEDHPLTPTASAHVAGLQLVGAISDEGSNVGKNSSSLVGVNGTATYTYYAEREGNHLLYSTAATTGGEGDGGSLGHGLFGSVNVEPRGAEWYRSQVTAEELKWATKKNPDGTDQQSAAGHPVIDYAAKYPSTHPKFPNKPILNMLDGTEIFHSDLNGIITGPGRGNFAPGTYPAVTNIAYDREQPFREFTVIYHDETKAVQAFPQFNDEKTDGAENPLAHTLHGVRDAFGINYGIGGIGAEIIANRLGIGPMGNCSDCLYEEFFLSSWAVGDPAMIVDKPAGAQVDKNGNRIPNSTGATRAYYPDDPSNVHHSYLNDHVKMRVVHAGPKEHHVHHLHAHQWLRTPDSDKSSYLDSQALGPGYAFTTEIAHGGSGNLNKTVGDSIFHCHFYPHFAQGMWALWRVHDVFEAGTELNAKTGLPTSAARKLPDAEIAAGTPIPAIVPLPTLAMAPMPSTAFQGFPFYIPGVVGHRPPHPPLDTIDDGGLPRHVIVGGTVAHHKAHLPAFDFDLARLDFDKSLLTADAFEVPEGGTTAEIAAMNFHGQRQHPSYKPDGAAATFIANGLPRKTKANPTGSQAGAPYADPCVDRNGNPVGTPRIYKSANIQLDLTLNKAGWHFPQSRIATLWNDVRPTLDKTRPAEPLFIRAHSGDCITFHHTNLVPRVYVQDDFQVRTPTDIMGQHIHLVKFDVTASDGAGNGWNYEDGTFSPGEVQERIHAINAFGGLLKPDGTRASLTLKQHPFFGLSGKDEDGNGIDDWLGAQTTIQRWYADPVKDNSGTDRTLNTVFTHDHYGPSTHQQTGFYGGLVVEKPGSRWFHSETGQQLSTSPIDGGPTTWQAKIDFPANPAESFREFLLEFADFQLAYKKGGGIDGRGRPVPDPASAINPPAKKEIGLPFLVEAAPVCPGTTVAPPCPEAISAIGHGTMTVNYRNEPLALRVFNPSTQAQTAGVPGDLSHAYRSLTNRAIPELNYQPLPKLTNGVRPGDPATPLIRVFENDKVRIRVLVGAHEEGHNFGVHGLKWLFEPAEPNSGYRNNQMMGISEWFDFVVPPLPVMTGQHTDFLYTPGSSSDDQWNGLWGIIRAYRGKQATEPRWSSAAPETAASSAQTSGDESRQETSATTVTGETTDVIGEEETTGIVDDDTTTEGPLETLSNNPNGQAPDIAAFNNDYSSADANPDDNFTDATGADPSAVPPPVIESGTETGTTIDDTSTIDGTTETTTLTNADGSSTTTAGGETETTYASTSTSGSGVPVCPQDATRRRISVTAVSAQMALPQGTLFYNNRSGYGGQLHDPTAILFVRTNDLDNHNRVKPGVPVEPLVIRARAGECIELTLRNRLPSRLPDLPGFSTLPLLVERFNANQVRPSKYVGLHPQLLRYDVRLHNGVNVGLNPDRTVAPGSEITYRWYAGDIVNKGGQIVGRPIEFGATSLSSSDPIKHSNKGAMGALVIEPVGASWTLDSSSRAAAVVTVGGTSFREFVLLYQNDVNLRMSRDVADRSSWSDWPGLGNIPSDPTAVNPEGAAKVVGTTYGNGGGDPSFVNVSTGKNTGFAVPNLAEAEDSSDSGQKGFNYRTEPLWNRMGFAPNAKLEKTNDFNFTNSLSNTQVGGLDPVTPVFKATPGQAVRYRVVMPGGHWRNESFMLHGHIWEEEPYLANSTVIGARPISEWKGVYYGVGAQSHFDFLPKNGAGGKFRVQGDYLYRTFNSFGFDGGLWGIFRVKNEPLPTQVKDNQ